MIFQEYFNSVADVLAAKLKGYVRRELNNADKGELCEVFIKDFLFDSFGHLFQIFRGGKIVNSKEEYSYQLDVIVCRKRTIKLFSDKGVYPLESVMGVFSITSTLDPSKLEECCKGLLSIPKRNYKFNIPNQFPDSFKVQTANIYKFITPYTCVFAFDGSINDKWIKKLNDIVDCTDPALYSLLPSLIVVNKKGMILKSKINSSGISDKSQIKLEKPTFDFIDLQNSDYYGDCFGRIVNELFNLSHEELYMQFDYTSYFNRDLDFTD